MTDVNHGSAADRAEPNANLTASTMSFDPMVAQWLSLHMNSKERDLKDNVACNDARKQDEQSIADRGSKTMSAADKIKGDRDDLQGDFQAIGKHKGERGDDQTNRDDDMKIVKLDREILKKYGSHMSTEQIDSINQDIKAKLRTAGNSNSDIGKENQYIAADKNEISALRSGSPDQVETANQKQLALRKQDAALETRYVADNNKSITADDAVLRLFGKVEINK